MFGGRKPAIRLRYRVFNFWIIVVRAGLERLQNVPQTLPGFPWTEWSGFFLEKISASKVSLTLDMYVDLEWSGWIYPFLVVRSSSLATRIKRSIPLFWAVWTEFCPQKMSSSINLETYVGLDSIASGMSLIFFLGFAPAASPLSLFHLLYMHGGNFPPKRCRTLEISLVLEKYMFFQENSSRMSSFLDLGQSSFFLYLTTEIFISSEEFNKLHCFWGQVIAHM